VNALLLLGVILKSCYVCGLSIFVGLSRQPHAPRPGAAPWTSMLGRLFVDAYRSCLRCTQNQIASPTRGSRTHVCLTRHFDHRRKPAHIHPCCVGTRSIASIAITQYQYEMIVLLSARRPPIFLPMFCIHYLTDDVYLPCHDKLN
jgi:hypothetical protein